ncbi:hypothetical protein FQZ97_663940 [compost metagenome]
MACADAHGRTTGAQPRRALGPRRRHRHAGLQHRSSIGIGPHHPHLPHAETRPVHGARPRRGRHGVVRRPGLQPFHPGATDGPPRRRARSPTAHPRLAQGQLRRCRRDRRRLGHGRRRAAGRLGRAPCGRGTRVRRIARSPRGTGRHLATRADAARRPCTGPRGHDGRVRLRWRRCRARTAAARAVDGPSTGARRRRAQRHRRRSVTSNATGRAGSDRRTHRAHAASLGSRAPAR